jgi:hypothetical protein
MVLWLEIKPWIRIARCTQILIALCFDYGLDTYIWHLAIEMEQPKPSLPP